MVVLWGLGFLMSEVPLYSPHSCEQTLRGVGNEHGVLGFTVNPNP